MSVEYHIHVPKSVKKALKKIPLQHRRKLIHSIDLLKNEPFLGFPMGGEMKDCYKIRVWLYRIIYKMHKSDKIIEILEAARRGNISYD